MTHGKIQTTSAAPLEKRVITISRPQRFAPQADGDDPLFLNVLRRRWMLLAVCLLLSLVAAAVVGSRFRMPKATTTAQLRYVPLPPTLQSVYQAPMMQELVELITSNEKMAELAKRTGVQIEAKVLAKQFNVYSTHGSNIIDIEFRWRDAPQAIDMVNTLMQIACETTAASRKQTLSQYAADTNLQYEAAHQRVASVREHVNQLRQERQLRLNGDGNSETVVKQLMDKLTRTEDAIDQLTLQRVAYNQQLAKLKRDLEAYQTQVRDELLKGRRQQLQTRLKAFNPNSERHVQLQRLEQQLQELGDSLTATDYIAWRAKLEATGVDMLGEIDPVTLAGVSVLERSLTFTEQKIEQVSFDMIPLDTQLSSLENQRESLERRLDDAMGAADIASTQLDEAEAQLKEAMSARENILNNLNNIRRGEETDFSEMTVLTPASYQTTERSEGKLKLFVFTLAGCFVVLTMPVFALEHFFPSGDPADAAAKALGIPRVSRGTFVTQRGGKERRQLHPVNSEAMRLLALRIQQSVHGPGPMVLFSGLNHEKSAIPMISYLAECLSRREERVLIMDACDQPEDARQRTQNEENLSAFMSTANETTLDEGEIAADSGERNLPANVAPESRLGVVGLADFLHRRDLGPDDLICPTSIPGVDIIPCGTTTFPREGLASSSLTALLEECRQRYTMILVAGPSTSHPSDLQMLSARADGILFTVPSVGRSAGKGEDVVRDLLDLGAPVIGIVS